MKNLLKIEIDRLFYEDRTLCKDIRLDLQSGERILIVGATGTGKSSLLNTLNLMNQNYEGRIFFEDKELKDFKPEILRSRICMVMQEPWLEDGSVQDNLDLPLGYGTHSDKNSHDRAKRIEDLMKSFQLPVEYLKKSTAQLSGGEKQRIALIRALLLRPDILLLDEISSALDQKTSGIISDCIFSNYPGAVIAISHDPLWQSRWQRQWLLEDGKLLDQQIKQEEN